MAKRTIVISETDLVNLLYDKGHMIHETSGDFTCERFLNIREEEELFVSYTYEDETLEEDETEQMG